VLLLLLLLLLQVAVLREPISHFLSVVSHMALVTGNKAAKRNLWPCLFSSNGDNRSLTKTHAHTPFHVYCVIDSEHVVAETSGNRGMLPPVPGMSSFTRYTWADVVATLLSQLRPALSPAGGSCDSAEANSGGSGRHNDCVVRFLNSQTPVLGGDRVIYYPQTFYMGPAATVVCLRDRTTDVVQPVSTTFVNFACFWYFCC
jgi:hypothetical protein